MVGLLIVSGWRILPNNISSRKACSRTSEDDTVLHTSHVDGHWIQYHLWSHCIEKTNKNYVSTNILHSVYHWEWDRDSFPARLDTVHWYSPPIIAVLVRLSSVVLLAVLPSRVSTHWNKLSGPPSPKQMKTACWVRLALMTVGVAVTLPSGDTVRRDKLYWVATPLHTLTSDSSVVWCISITNHWSGSHTTIITKVNWTKHQCTIGLLAVGNKIVLWVD